MHEYWELFKKAINPETVFVLGGFALLVFVIFAETGLMIGFFLPGDSLVFLAGMYCGSDPDRVSGVNIFTLAASLSLAAIIGNLVGYFFGKRVGPALFTKNDNLIFKKRYIDVTRAFYEKYGSKALILGRF